MKTLYDQSKNEYMPPAKLSRLADAAARLVPLCSLTEEFQGAKLSFDFRVIDGRLQIQNLVLELGPPTKLIIQ